MSSEKYQFHNLQELKNWLDQFSQTDLSIIYLETEKRDCLTIEYATRRLTDGSEATDCYCS